MEEFISQRCLTGEFSLWFVESCPNFVEQLGGYTCLRMLLMEIVPIMKKPIMIRCGVVEAIVYVLLFVPVVKEVSGMLCYFVRVNNSLTTFLQNVQH